MTGHDLLLTQLALACIGLDFEERLIRLPGPHPDGIPRFYNGQLHEGIVTYYHHNLPLAIRVQLAALPLAQAREDHAAVCAILSQHAPCESIWSGASYVIARPIAAADHPDVRRLDPRDAAEHELLQRFDLEVAGYGWPVYAVVMEGQVVAACVSSRENAVAGEAWVQTLPEFRRRGYAQQTTAAWAGALQQAGKLAFYSHSCDNLASAGVMRRLGLQPYLRDVGYL